MWKIAWLLMVLFNGPDGKEPTDRLVPAGWRGNPWGPEATRARAGGEIPPVRQTPKMKQWDAWGRTVLRDGDIVFRRGDARILFGRFPFSRFLALASNSRFSHTGIVAIEGGEPVVYDITKDGVQRQPFCVWNLNNVGALGVKRVRNEDRACAARAVGYCRELFARQPPFDFRLDIDDAAYYCVEMTEKAYRSAGIALSEPVRLGDMEDITRYPLCVLAAVNFAHLSLEQRVYMPGNARHGIWSCPRLVTVYESPSTPEERQNLFGRASKSDLDTFEGTWKVVSHRKYTGESAPPRESIFVVFKGNDLVVKTKDSEVRATFRLDPAATPKTVDLRGQFWKLPVNIAGCYRLLDGDAIQLRWSERGKRPAGFSSSQLEKGEREIVLIKAPPAPDARR